MKRVNFYIPNQLYEDLQALAKEKELTFSEILRRACEEYLKRQKRYGKK